MRTNYQNSNIRENTYYIKFQACKKCWTKGTILGIPAGIVCGLLFSGFELNDIFFGMAALFSVSCIWTFATVMGMRNTAGFGLSCVPLGIFRCGASVLGFFAGTYVLLWVAALLAGIALFAWLLAFMFFAAVFPLETLYYWLRYTLEKRAIQMQPATAA